MVNAEKNGVKSYFNSIPKEWDALYSHENLLKYTVDKLFRSALYRRYQRIFEYCGQIEGKRILDIGCGTGRYSIEFAKRGAAHVTGIDFSPSMIEFSQRAAREMGVEKPCEFVCDNFLAHHFPDKFDIVIAVGFFDYVLDPKPIFEKISELTHKSFLASFPKYTLIHGTQRKIRYNWIKKCPVYFYTDSQLDLLCREAPFSQFNIFSSRRGLFLVAKNNEG